MLKNFMSEQLGHAPPEAGGAPEIVSGINIEVLRGAEFAREAPADELAAGVDLISNTAGQQTGDNLFEEARAAQAALKREASGGFLTDIRNSAFYQKLVRLTLGASIMLSFALPAKAEVGESTDQDTTEETESALQILTEARLEAQKSTLDEKTYDALKLIIDDILNSDLSELDQRKAIDASFEAVGATATGGRNRSHEETRSSARERLSRSSSGLNFERSSEYARLAEELEQSHDTKIELTQNYTEAETETDRLAALEALGRYAVNSAKEKGANTPVGEIVVNFKTFQLTAEVLDDAGRYTFTDVGNGTAVTFEM